MRVANAHEAHVVGVDVPLAAVRAHGQTDAIPVDPAVLAEHDAAHAEDHQMPVLVAQAEGGDSLASRLVIGDGLALGHRGEREAVAAEPGVVAGAAFRFRLERASAVRCSRGGGSPTVAGGGGGGGSATVAGGGGGSGRQLWPEAPAAVRSPALPRAPRSRSRRPPVRERTRETRSHRLRVDHPSSSARAASVSPAARVDLQHCLVVERGRPAVDDGERGRLQRQARRRARPRATSPRRA